MKPIALPQEYLTEFGDPGLSRVIAELRAAREELREANEAAEEEDDMTVEEMGREESRYLDRQNARHINRKIG